MVVRYHLGHGVEHGGGVIEDGVSGQSLLVNGFFFDVCGQFFVMDI